MGDGPLIRPDGPSPFPPSVHIGFRQTALGDSVATLPAIVYALKTYPSITFQIWPPDYQLDLIKRALDGFPNAVIRPASLIATQADHELPAALNKFTEGHTTLKTRLVEYAFRCLLDHDPPAPEDTSYIEMPPVELPKNLTEQLGSNYVVFTTNYTSSTRVFLPEVAEPIIDYVVSKGHRPVFLGQNIMPTGTAAGAAQARTSQINTKMGVDLLNKTTLLEAHSIMANAQAVVGVDNGLLHLAAMSDVPIVAGFTNVNPAMREPVRRGEYARNWASVVPKGLSCAPCQSWHYSYGVQFTDCFYKDFKCLRLNPGEFISALQKFGI